MSVTPKTTLREAAVRAREGSKKLVDWIDEARVLAGTADFAKQFGSDLAALLADAASAASITRRSPPSCARLLTRSVKKRKGRIMTNHERELVLSRKACTTSNAVAPKT